MGVATGVTLKCTKGQEATSYADIEGHIESADLIACVCHTLPIHVIWGAMEGVV